MFSQKFVPRTKFEYRNSTNRFQTIQTNNSTRNFNQLGYINNMNFPYLELLTTIQQYLKQKFQIHQCIIIHSINSSTQQEVFLFSVSSQINIKETGQRETGKVHFANHN